MIPPEFNIFNVLEKDGKELVHSAFIKFLMEKDTSFYTYFLNVQGPFRTPKLERQYTYLKHQRGRFDIEAESQDGSALVVIENKFKSFPYPEQFKLYDKILNKHHSKSKISKFLLCFDKEVVGVFPNWAVRDYNDLLVFIESFYDMNAVDDQSVFIRHYYFMLKNYFEEYRALKANLRPLFVTLRENDKFWLKLFYSALQLKLDSYFRSIGLNVGFYLSTGNTQIPLLNIVPAHWNIAGKEFLIQFQGNDIKFYSHCTDKPFLNDIVFTAQNALSQEHYEYKKFTRAESKSYFIVKTKVTQEAIGETIDLETLFVMICDFYHTINNKVMVNYHSVT